MNPASVAEAKKLFISIRKAVKKSDVTTVAIAPPSVFLSDLARLSPSGRVRLGVQRIWSESTGPQTGEISAPMVLSAGVTYVIIGHSERRAQGIDDVGVHDRLQAALKHNLVPIVCIGEKKRDDSGDFYQEVESQLKATLKDLKKSQVVKTIFAYEPVWAIGSGVTPTTGEIQEMRLFIEKVITQTVDRATARKVRVLYGGSVNDKNAGEILRETTVQGFLVGGASLKPDMFAKIIKSAG